MIFGQIKCDTKVMTGDQLHIDVSKTFLAPTLEFEDTESLMLSLDEGVNWFDVSDSKKLDWMFSTSGDKIITLKVTAKDQDPVEFTQSIQVIDLSTANLFSLDIDLYPYEPNIDSLRPDKWTSWNLLSLTARDLIVQWLDEKGIRKSTGEKYLASDIKDKSQVKAWSCALVLKLIYQGNSNQVGDVFKEKCTYYETLASQKMQLAHIELTGQSYNETSFQTTDLRSVTVNRV